jgi:hypothetical protein
MTISAPGFTAGPRQVAGGLLWSGAGGVFASSSAGVSRLVARGASLSSVAGDQDWIAVSGPRGVRAARLGRRLIAVEPLHQCPPVESPAGSQPRAPLVALSGVDLYSVVASRCVHVAGPEGPVLVRVPLSTDGVHILARVRAGAVSVVAAGSRVALTYVVDAPLQGARADVVNAANGRALFVVRFRKAGSLPGSLATQIDSRGDVVLTSRIFVSPGELAEGWWGNQRHRVARALGRLEVGAYPEPFTHVAIPPEVAIALSDGRLAYATYPHGGGLETIDVRDLATNGTRTVVSFPGSAGVLGISIRDTQLAWAQQSLGFTTPTTTDPCVTRTQALGPVQLVSASIDVSAPVSEPGQPVPRRKGPLCPLPP